MFTGLMNAYCRTLCQQRNIKCTICYLKIEVLYLAFPHIQMPGACFPPCCTGKAQLLQMFHNRDIRCSVTGVMSTSSSGCLLKHLFASSLEKLCSCESHSIIKREIFFVFVLGMCHISALNSYLQLECCLTRTQSM